MTTGPVLGCGCTCHRWPGVNHVVACCDAPPYNEDNDLHSFNATISPGTVTINFLKPICFTPSDVITLTLSEGELDKMNGRVNDSVGTCGAYYGTGDSRGSAICNRLSGHPPYSEDKIGHSDTIRTTPRSVPEASVSPVEARNQHKCDDGSISENPGENDSKNWTVEVKYDDLSQVLDWAIHTLNGLIEEGLIDKEEAGPSLKYIRLRAALAEKMMTER